MKDKVINHVRSVGPRDRSRRIRSAVVAGALALAPAAAKAQTPTAPDPTIYTSAMTATQTYVNALVATHGVQAIFISLAVVGLMFVWRLTHKAFH